MEVKAGYKKTDVGLIPESWDAGNLGKYWSVTDCKHITAKFIQDGIPVASIREVQSRYVDLTNAKMTTEFFYKSLIEGGRKPQNGDLILSRNATVGEVAQVTADHPQFAMGQDVCLLRKKQADFSTGYLHSILQSPIVINQLLNLMVGSTFKRINIEQIRAFLVPMAPPPEQHAIATALSDVDALLEGLEQLIAKKRNIKQATMQQLLTGQTRLPQFANHPDGKPKEYKKTELGETPEDWDICELKDAVDFLDGLRRPVKSGDRAKISGEFPYYGASGIVDYVNDYLFDDDLILLGEDGENILSRNLPLAFRVSGKIWVNNHAHVLKPKPGFDIAYLTEFLESLDYSLLNSGTAQPKLNKQTCLKIVIVKPSKEEQSAIAVAISDMDTELTALESRLTKTRALKQGIMQELLTGRTRLV